MTKINMVEALRKAMFQEMKRDDAVITLGEDVAVNGGVFRITDGLLKKYGAGRVFDTPLGETSIIGCSIGLALYGFKPVAEIQFSGFLYLGLNHLINHASRFRNRSRGKLTCPMVVRTPYCGGIRALEHHSESMEALFAHTPGLKVVIPSTPYEAKGLLASAIRDPDTVIFMEPKRLYHAIKEEVPEEEYTIPIGKARVVQEGTDVTLIAYGAMLWIAQKALKNTNHSVELIDLRTISPLDMETIVASVKKTGRCVIVHEAPQSFGPAAEISAQLNEKAIFELEAPVLRVCGFDTVMPLYRNEMNYIPNEKRINRAIDEVLGY